MSVEAEKGGGYEYSLELAAAYEFLETAILAHDDVFDNAKLRRDVPTIHEACRERYAASPDGTVRRALRGASRAAAICAGDIGFYEVNKQLIDAYRTDARILDVLGALQDIVTRTIKGELLDILLPVEERSSPLEDGALFEAALSVNRMKTAAYTTSGPLTLGMRLAGAPEPHVRRVEEFAILLGVAFQLKDDLLDLFGPAKQGKPRGADIAEHKITCLYALARRSPAAREILRRYYGKAARGAALSEIRRAMEECGARAAVEAELAAALKTCRARLSELDFIPETDKEILSGFTGYLEQRRR
jgi:geranylgeranyl pyrophosphate synthase